MPGEGRRSREKGDRREHELARGLELAGFLVTRAGGSLGLFDLIASRRDLELFIQAKSNRWAGTLEAQALAEAPILRDEKVYRVIARIDDGDPLVRARVTKYGEAWYRDTAIESVLTQALRLARVEQAQKRRARDGGSE